VAGQGRYWRIPSSRTGVAEEARSRERVEALRETLAEATAQRSVSDVPLGAFLSGRVRLLNDRCSHDTLLERNPHVFGRLSRT
jgi:hypothetical protein